MLPEGHLHRFAAMPQSLETAQRDHPNVFCLLTLQYLRRLWRRFPTVDAFQSEVYSR
jgi:hypothetical protein